MCRCPCGTETLSSRETPDGLIICENCVDDYLDTYWITDAAEPDRREEEEEEEAVDGEDDGESEYSYYSESEDRHFQNASRVALTESITKFL